MVSQAYLIIGGLTAAIALVGLGVTILVLLIRGGYMLGKLTQKVDNMEKTMETGFSTMNATIEALRADVQQSNRTLAAIANHRHHTDGNTQFTIPPA